MPLITLEYDSKNEIAVSTIKLLRKLNVFSISRPKKVEQEHYDKKFVKKITKSKNSKGRAIKTEDLWK